MTYGPRTVQPDDEGYVYFVKVRGYTYGPYSTRGTAAGVGTQKSQSWGNRQQIWDSTARRWVRNPDYVVPPTPEVLRSRLGDMEPAPRLTQAGKLAAALEENRKLRSLLARLGGEAEAVSEVPSFKGY